MTESGVMCCDIHPKYPFLVAIGLYDGNVHVYNLKENYREPLYVSMGVGDKHIECVWEVGIKGFDPEIRALGDYLVFYTKNKVFSSFGKFCKG